MTKQKTTKVSEPKAKRNINVKGMFNELQAWVAMVLLAGLAYQGVLSLIDANPSVATGIGLVTVLLLVKTAQKR